MDNREAVFTQTMKPNGTFGVFRKSEYRGEYPVPRVGPVHSHSLVGVLMEDSEKALARLEREIAARLKPVCSHMPEAEFNAMVRDIAQFKLKHQADENGTSSGVEMN